MHRVHVYTIGPIPMVVYPRIALIQDRGIHTLRVACRCVLHVTDNMPPSTMVSTSDGCTYPRGASVQETLRSSPGQDEKLSYM